jgi:hypothetical protein
VDNLFKIRVLTAAVNNIQPPPMTIYNRLFRGREHLEPSDRLSFDIITGNETLLPNISVIAPATVDSKTGRKTVTMTAPRLADKRFIHTSEMNALRAFGSQGSVEMLQQRIAREQRDMKDKHSRTLEYWAASALKGTIYDSDMSTELVNYGVADSHTPTLSGNSLWSSSSSKPVNKIREWKKLIGDDAGTTITGWVMFCGSSVMDNLLTHSSVLDLLKYTGGVQIAQSGRIGTLAGVEIIEYHGSFTHTDGTTKRFIDDDYVLLVGLCADLVDVPFAPVVDSDSPQGVGNVQAGGTAPQMYFSKSWKENDPSGRWIKVESRPLPVLQRPGAVVYAKVV